jgi:hypothetical protein
LPSRSPGRRWIACTNSENRSGLARRAHLGPEVSIQTRHAYQEGRTLCPTCLHLTSIAGAVAGHVCPTRLQRLLPRSIEGRGERPHGTGLMASLGEQLPLGGPADFRLLRTGQTLPVAAPVTRSPAGSPLARASARSTAGAPPAKWTVVLTSLTYNDVTLHVQQPPGTDVLVDSLGNIDP